MKLLSTMLLSGILLCNNGYAGIVHSQYVVWITNSMKDNKPVTSISNPISLPDEVSISEIQYMFSKHVAQKTGSNALIITNKNIQIFNTKEEALEFKKKSISIAKNMGNIIVDDIVLSTDPSIVPQSRIQAIDNTLHVLSGIFYPFNFITYKRN